MLKFENVASIVVEMLKRFNTQKVEIVVGK